MRTYVQNYGIIARSGPVYLLNHAIKIDIPHGVIEPVFELVVFLLRHWGFICIDQIFEFVIRQMLVGVYEFYQFPFRPAAARHGCCKVNASNKLFF